MSNAMKNLTMSEKDAPGKERSIPRPRLIRQSRQYVHTHLGAPSGFGKTVLLDQLYRHFMRSGRGPRRGVFIDAARQSPEELLLLFPSPPGTRTIVAADNLAPGDMGILHRLLTDIEKTDCSQKLRIFTAGPPLPLRPFTLHKTRGTTLELNMEDLAFTREEALELLPVGGGELWARTAGWPLPFRYLMCLPALARDLMLDDPESMLRSGLRDRIRERLTQKGLDLLTHMSVLHRLDAKTLRMFADPQELLPYLLGMVARGCPLFFRDDGLQMHPLMRRCLLSDLSAHPGAEAIRQDAIRLYREDGNVFQAARVAREAELPELLAEILADLNGTPPPLEPERKREFDGWLDWLAERKEALPARVRLLIAAHRNDLHRHTDARSEALEALSRAEAESDAETGMHATLLMARLTRRSGSLAESDRLLESLRQSSASSLDWPLRCGIASELAYNRLLACNFRESLAIMKDLQETAARKGDSPTALSAERFMTLPYFFLGEHTRALTCFEETKHLTGDRLPNRFDVRSIAARCLQLQGFQVEARKLRESRPEAEKSTNAPDNLLMDLLVRAELEFFEREAEGRGADLAGAEGLLKQARTLLSRDVGNPFFQAWSLGYAFMLKAFSRPKTIRRGMSAALREARQYSPLLYAALLLRFGTFCFPWPPEPAQLPEMIAVLRECAAAAERIGARTILARAQTALAVVFEFAGLRETARRCLKDAFAYFEREKLFGLFRIVPKMAPAVRMARKYGVAPVFTNRVVDQFEYRPQRVCLKLFGRFEAVPLPGGTPEPILRARVRELFAWLVLHGNHPVRREEIVRDLWPGLPPARGNRMCTVTLSQLRAALRSLGLSEALAADGPVCVMDTRDISTNLEGLEHLEAVAKILPRLGGDPAGEFERLRLAPLQEGFLGEFASPWAREAARQIDALVARAGSEIWEMQQSTKPA